MSQIFDAITIETSIVGTSTAFHFTERGLKPVILERKQTGVGSMGFKLSPPCGTTHSLNHIQSSRQRKFYEL